MRQGRATCARAFTISLRHHLTCIRKEFIERQNHGSSMASAGRVHSCGQEGEEERQSPTRHRGSPVLRKHRLSSSICSVVIRPSTCPLSRFLSHRQLIARLAPSSLLCPDTHTFPFDHITRVHLCFCSNGRRGTVFCRQVGDSR